MGKKGRMPEVRQVAEEEIGAAQAAELTLLLDLEARWENLRARPGQEPRRSRPSPKIYRLCRGLMTPSAHI